MSPRSLLPLAVFLWFTPAQANTAQLNTFDFILDAAGDPSCGCYDGTQTMSFVVLPNPALHALTGGDAEISLGFSQSIAPAACMTDPSDPAYGLLQCSYSYTVDARLEGSVDGIYASGGDVHIFGDDISTISTIGPYIYPDTSGFSIHSDVEYISYDAPQSDFNSRAEFSVSLSTIQGTVELVPEPITAPAILLLALALYLRNRRDPLRTPNPS